jgi:hypothetical protein
VSEERGVPQGAPGTPNEADWVRNQSARQATRKVDRETWECLQTAAGADRERINAHLAELAHETDMERYLQTNASILAFAGTMLGAATGKKKWLILPGIVLPFLLEHAFQGWCPPMPLFRKMGVRTRKEINRERYALKAMRGDFGDVQGSPERNG